MAPISPAEVQIPHVLPGEHWPWSRMLGTNAYPMRWRTQMAGISARGCGSGLWMNWICASMFFMWGESHKNQPACRHWWINDVQWCQMIAQPCRKMCFATLILVAGDYHHGSPFGRLRYQPTNLPSEVPVVMGSFPSLPMSVHVCTYTYLSSYLPIYLMLLSHTLSCLILSDSSCLSHLCYLFWSVSICSYLFSSVLICSYLFLSVLVCSCLFFSFLSVLVCSSHSNLLLSILTCSYLSLFVLI